MFQSKTNTKVKRIFLALVFMSSFIYAQSEMEFSEKVEIIKYEQNENYTKPKVILFEFSGDTHSINYYLDLSKQLKKRFRKIGVKSKFNYNLHNPSPLKADLESIPERKFNKSDFQFVCYLKMKDFNSWDNHLLEKRKQNYKLEIKLEKMKNESVFILLDINTYYTIANQNKVIASTIAQKLK